MSLEEILDNLSPEIVEARITKNEYGYSVLIRPEHRPGFIVGCETIAEVVEELSEYTAEAEDFL